MGLSYCKVFIVQGFWFVGDFLAPTDSKDADED